MKRLFTLLLAASLAACSLPAEQNAPTVEKAASQPAATPTLEAAQPSLAVEAATEETLPAAAIEAPIVESPSIIDIEMMNSNDGWAVTETQIVRTDDGGVTWYDVTPPTLTEAGYSVFTEFIDPSHAWIQVADIDTYPNGGTLHRTRDGGLTWEVIETPFSSGEMEFVNPEQGWMLADLGVGAGSMAVSIFRTSNGGTTWERAYTNDPNYEDAGDTLPLRGIKAMLTPRDDMVAWVGGVVYASGTVYLFRTEDGGGTWFEIGLLLPENLESSELAVEAIHFVSKTRGFLLLRVTGSAPGSLIYLTEDGGTTWQALSGVFPRVNGLNVLSAREFVFYSGSQFHVTKDAGETFDVITPDVKFGDSITDMSFSNTSTGWVVTTSATGRRSLYKTTDGARTWFPIIP